MVNAWSLLYDEINGTMDETYPIKKKNMKNNDVTVLGGEGQDTLSVDQSWWADDGFSVTGNPAGSSQDTITFVGSNLPGGLGEDHISFSGVAGTQWDDSKYYARTDGYPGSVSDALRFSHEGPSTINFVDDP